MIDTHLSIGKFLIGWAPAALISAQVDPAPQLAEALTLPIGGFHVPVITCLLGILGVLLARPLARKREASQGLISWALVSAIMLVVVEIWIIDSRPSALFAFVLAIGLGFSGYSLIEIAGTEATDLIRRVLPGSPPPPTPDPDPVSEDKTV